MASMIVMRMTDSVGSSVIHQRTMETPATANAIQSNVGNVLFPTNKATTEMAKHASAVMPVTHAPAPAPSTICATNAIAVSTPHTSHVNAWGFVTPPAMLRKYNAYPQRPMTTADAPRKS